jgi:phosphate starvation-inducible protein PhoH
MTDVVHKLSVEGADPLLLAGVNDANLLEVQRALGVRASLRGDTLSVSGSVEQIERAVPVLQGLIEMARLGDPVSVDDVMRLATDGPPVEAPGAADAARIVFPGLKRPIATSS